MLNYDEFISRIFCLFFPFLLIEITQDQMNRSGRVIGNSTNPQLHSYSTFSNDQQHQQNILSTATNLLSNASNAASGSLFGNRSNLPKGPQVIPQTGSNIQQHHTQAFNSKTDDSNDVIIDNNYSFLSHFIANFIFVKTENFSKYFSFENYT